MLDFFVKYVHYIQDTLNYYFHEPIVYTYIYLAALFMVSIAGCGPMPGNVQVPGFVDSLQEAHYEDNFNSHKAVQFDLDLKTASGSSRLNATFYMLINY